MVVIHFMVVILTQSRSLMQTTVTGQNSRPHEENVAKIVGTTSSDGSSGLNLLPEVRLNHHQHHHLSRQ